MPDKVSFSKKSIQNAEGRALRVSTSERRVLESVQRAMKAKAEQKDKPVVNFAILNNVENYTETSGKFRTKYSSFRIPGQDSGSASALYFPYCDKQRFDFGPFLNEMRGHGVFTPHQTGEALGDDGLHLVPRTLS